MADSLRRLVNIGTFTVLQDKLEKWLSDYYINTCDQNVARGCEIIELNAKVQGQLFKLLSVCASDGGMYGGANIIKSRLLPWLGQNFFTSGGSVTADTSLSVLAEASAKDREINDLQDMYEKSMDDLERDLESMKTENQDLRDELADTKVELDRSMRASTSEKMFTDVETSELRRNLRSLKRLAAAEEECKNLRNKAGLLNDYQSEIRRLRDDIALLTARRDVLQRVPPKDISYDVNGLSDSMTSYRYTSRITTPLAIDDPVQRVRQQNLVARFNDMFAQDRLDALDTLRRYSDDHENNQRIIYCAVSEAFSTAKLAFRQFKMKVRANLAKTHYGPETLEEAVQDYINRNSDLYDLPGMVSDVIRALNRNPKIFLPPDATFAIVQPFIREACKLAWQMSALAHPLDIAASTDAELFDDNKYRRSYDSEYTAPLVNHHIWPCLMQGIKTLVKGEALTRRGASLTSSGRRSRSPTRSLSPTRALSPSFRSRSVSPLRRSRCPSPRRCLSPLGRRSPTGRWL
ncbi:mitochondria-eating protein-like isoform X4 [Haliotis rubra]|uniref:mitochondria-eating protein-like isoform X4 n=1 Tax=Haliotis rubra TaxID=36100 RepID=UPI001EE5AFB2|nr:mitochondria-eating protein-like isoform X4 [Haliotis rubra]